MESLLSLYENCRLCPRECCVNRNRGETGFCRMPSVPKLGRVSLHMWEEPCISGTRGSGTVFFAGCSLGCIYCQNRTMIPDALIPGGGTDLPHCPPVTSRELADYFLQVQSSGAHNLNLVTAAHFLPHAAEALKEAKEGGLNIPVVYNTSGYEKPESLKMLEGLVDIYLTDFRYMDPETASRYSHADNYPDAAKSALREMLRQCPQIHLEDGLMKRGVLVRVLLLPGHVKEAKEIVSFLHASYGSSVRLSLLSQYTPLPHLKSDPLLSRKVTKREYDRLVDHALSLGIADAYIQEGSAAKESFIPVFHGECLLNSSHWRNKTHMV